VVDRHGASGPLAVRLDEVAHADDFLPLLAVAVLFALEPAGNVATRVPLRDWPAITVGLGLLLGGGAALLARSELRLEDTWGVLFGVTLMAVGTSARLGLSTLTAAFFAGIAVSLFSRHRRELRAMVGPTERPVLLPALLLAGARIDLHMSPALPWIAAAAIGTRLVAKVVVGWMLAASSRSARKGGLLVGLSLMSSGGLAVCIGLADTVLAIAVLSATAGEFIGPVRLRRALRAAGEIGEAEAASPAPGRVAA
jgi:Kef-type K+ transport system membrane component KefB